MKTCVYQYVKIFALWLFLFFVFLSLPGICDGHEPTGDGHHHHDHSHHAHSEINEAPAFKYSKQANDAQSQPPYSSRKPRKQMSVSSLWIEALSSTLIISIAPFLILFFVPLNSKREHESLLKVLLSFACGGLLGDAFLHLIPHALEPHSHQHGHEHSHHEGHNHSHHEGHQHSHGNIGTWVLCGILTFLIIEKSVRLMKGDHGHSHSHSDRPLLVANDAAASANDDKAKKEDEDGTEDAKSKGNVDNDNSDSMSESEDEIQIAGYLNLAADFTHNFTDGLAIGASYLAGETVGLVTTITILFHEVPHEIGDFAILVQSGCSKKKAMLLQMLTAFGAILGTVLSLISGGGVDVGATSWVLPFTAGGFIYIAAVSIIPELLTNSTFVQSVKEIFALLAGVFMMVLVAQFE
ncbi:hypothetical protein V9T40_000042 [Parthenolecanium corni]|uniref:Uncharacterized protein n=1 Tax=Parthenolecanium corni TaxID=536013 RepID=A0AAN9TUU3_9HEMI